MTSEKKRQREKKCMTEKGVMRESVMGKALPKVNPRISRDLIIKILKFLYYSTYNSLLQDNNIFCIPESINANISHQLFDYKITFVNS